MDKAYKKVKSLCGFNVRLLSFKYLGPTDRNGSRVKIYDKRFKRSKTIPFDHTYNNNAGEVAADYLIENGWDISGINEDYGNIIISNWDPDQQL